MSHPDGAWPAVATDGLMTKRLPPHLPHDSSHPWEGVFGCACRRPQHDEVCRLLGVFVGRSGEEGVLWDRLLCLSLSPECELWKLEAPVALEIILRC